MRVGAAVICRRQAHDLGPAGSLPAATCGGCRPATWDGVGAELLRRLLHGFHRGGLLHAGRELVHDGGRRASRRQQGIGGGHRVVLHALFDQRGQLGQCGGARGRGHGQQPDLAAGGCGSSAGRVSMTMSIWPPSRSVMAGPLPRYGTHQPRAGDHLEQFAGHVLRGARPGRAVGDGPRLGLGQRDQLLHVARRHLAVDRQRHGHAGRHRHADEGRAEVIAGLVGHGGVDRMAAHRAHQQRVAVGSRLGHDSAPIRRRRRPCSRPPRSGQIVAQVLGVDARRRGRRRGKGTTMRTGLPGQASAACEGPAASPSARAAAANTASVLMTVSLGMRTCLLGVGSYMS